MSDIRNVRDEGLDKFYTKPDISKMCIDLTDELYSLDIFDLIVEPSAGNGSFLKQLPIDKSIGLDIRPDSKDIISKDFFAFYPDSTKNSILTIGNPPFGKVNSLAVAFFNHASKWSNVIAFIIPRTFRKLSIQNRLNLDFHLIKDIDIPLKPCSFVPTMSVKCCFQIWERRPTKRERIKEQTKHTDWDFINYITDTNGKTMVPDNIDFAILAYGGDCGKIRFNELSSLNPKGWHFIRSKIDTNVLMDRFKSLDFSNCNNTARQNSIGKGELVSLYSNRYN